MPSSPSRQRGGFVLGLVLGLVVGLALALGVALYISKTPLPFIDKVPGRTAEQDAAEAEKNKGWNPNAPLAGKTPARPASAAASAASAPPVRDPAAILAGQEPAARLVEPPAGVEAQQTVDQGREELPRLLLEPLRVGAGDDHAHPAVDEGEEELVLRPLREDVLHLLARVQGGGDAEERPCALVDERAQRPLAPLGGLQESPVRVEERGVAALAERAQGPEEPQNVLAEAGGGFEHRGSTIARSSSPYCLNDSSFGAKTLAAAARSLRRDRGWRQERGMLRKILAVDDSALIHQMYKLFLSRYKNCRLVSAMNGLEALDKLGQEEGIDLILLDINMPVMNGLEFLQRVQKEGAYKDIPVIIISTEGKEEDTIRGLKMGARGYVKKPFQASELHSLIEKITGA